MAKPSPNSHTKASDRYSDLPSSVGDLPTAPKPVDAACAAIRVILHSTITEEQSSVELVAAKCPIIIVVLPNRQWTRLAANEWQSSATGEAAPLGNLFYLSADLRDHPMSALNAWRYSDVD
jgi:hypothetical protein